MSSGTGNVQQSYPCRGSRLCLVFSLDAMYVGGEWCMVCSQAKNGSLMCSVYFVDMVCLVWSLLVLVVRLPMIAQNLPILRLYDLLGCSVGDCSIVFTVVSWRFLVPLVCLLCHFLEYHNVQESIG